MTDKHLERARRKKRPKEYELLLVAGVEGYAMYLNGHRIAGPKPWGGGVIRYQWMVGNEDIERALRDR